MPDQQKLPEFIELESHLETFPYLNKARLMVWGHFKEHLLPDLAGPGAVAIIGTLLGYYFFQFPLGLFAVIGLIGFVLSYVILGLCLKTLVYPKTP